MEALDQAYEKIRSLEAQKNKREEEDADEDSVDKEKIIEEKIIEKEEEDDDMNECEEENIWAMEGDFYNRASLRWHSMILDDIWWYWIVNIYLNIGIFKFENPDFQIWISHCLSGESGRRDIQIWKSGYSNLKIGIFKFENKNDAV